MKSFLLIVLSVLTLSVMGQYQKGVNTISISHKLSKNEAFENLRWHLISQNYSIKKIDAESFTIETNYKKLETVKTRLIVKLDDSTIVFKGFVTNGVVVASLGGAMGISSSVSEYPNEYRSGKHSVVGIAFSEMANVATTFCEICDGDIKVFKDESL
jgi:hypothetical protein